MLVASPEPVLHVPTLLTVAAVGCVTWVTMVAAALYALWTNPREKMSTISMPEAVFVGSLALAAAYLCAALFSRFA